jgi:hypothetical protein
MGVYVDEDGKAVVSERLRLRARVAEFGVGVRAEAFAAGDEGSAYAFASGRRAQALRD